MLQDDISMKLQKKGKITGKKAEGFGVIGEREEWRGTAKGHEKLCGVM